MYLTETQNNINIIMATSLNFCIGKNGKIPWNIPSDLKFFKKMTENNVVIMGRKTFESLPDVLANRLNIVVTSQHKNSVPKKNLYFCYSIPQALHCANKYINNHLSGDDKQIFFIGGKSIYEKAYDYADNVYMTKIYSYVYGDVYLDTKQLFNCLSKFRLKGVEHSYDDVPHSYLHYVRK